MSLLARPFPAALAAVALAAASCAFATAAHADQFVEAADGAAIDCVLARGALTRIALVNDGFANVSKMASGYPYNDFEVTHEPVRGDIYVSVPLQYASAKVSFFATSSAGHVYTFACKVDGEEASQLFVTPLCTRSGHHRPRQQWACRQKLQPKRASEIPLVVSCFRTGQLMPHPGLLDRGQAA